MKTKSQRKVIRSKSIGLLGECEYVHRKVHANLAISSLDPWLFVRDNQAAILPLLCLYRQKQTERKKADFFFPPRVISFLLLHPSLLYVFPEE